MKTMQSINRLSKSDEIIGTIEYNGRALATLSRRNFSSVDEVMRALVTLAGNFVGLAKLHIRNKSQGWNLTMGVSSRRRLPQPQLAMTMPSRQQAGSGYQLSIP